MPEKLHEHIRVAAEAEGVSMNLFIVACLAAKVGFPHPYRRFVDDHGSDARR